MKINEKKKIRLFRMRSDKRNVAAIRRGDETDYYYYYYCTAADNGHSIFAIIERVRLYSCFGVRVISFRRHRKQTNLLIARVISKTAVGVLSKRSKSAHN